MVEVEVGKEEEEEELKEEVEGEKEVEDIETIDFKLTDRPTCWLMDDNIRGKTCDDASNAPCKIIRTFKMELYEVILYSV